MDPIIKQAVFWAPLEPREQPEVQDPQDQQGLPELPVFWDLKVPPDHQVPPDQPDS